LGGERSGIRGEEEGSTKNGPELREGLSRRGMKKKIAEEVNERKGNNN